MTTNPSPAATKPEAAIRQLQALDTDQLAAIISDNLDARTSPQLWDALRTPALARRTHEILTARYNDLCGQTSRRNADLAAYQQECFTRGPAGKKDYFVAYGEHQQWKRRVATYRSLLMARIGETKSVLSAEGRRSTTPNPHKRRRHMTAVFELAWAIHKHRETTRSLDIDAEDHDRELWRSLRKITVDTDDGPISVADFLDDAMDKPSFIPPDEREYA